MLESLAPVTNKSKLNRSIYSIQLVSQLLRGYKLIFVKFPQRSPLI